jgi:CHASE2 domain-containing sensor protein
VRRFKQRERQQKPNSSFFREERRSLIVACMLTLLMQSLEYHGWLAGPEGKVLDWLLRSRPDILISQARSPIFTLEIDDPAYAACFGSASPLDSAGVLTLVKETAAMEPAVVGVDILTDTLTPEGRSPYQPLPDDSGQWIGKVIWISGAGYARQDPASFPGWMAGKHDEMVIKPTPVLGRDAGELDEHPEIHWGLPVFPRDDDRGLRRVPRRVEISADPEHSELRKPHPSLARVVAETYCKGRAECRLDDGSDEEVYVPYGAKAPGRFHVLDVFRCSGKGDIAPGGALWEEFQNIVKRKIVLIGGSFGSARDFYETPSGRLPGLVVNAYAVQAEIDGAGLHEARRPLAILFDIVVGWLIVWVFWRFEHLPHGRRWAAWAKGNQVRFMLGGSVVLLIAAQGLNLVLFGRGYIFSFIGVGLGVLLHQIVEIWYINPQPHHKAHRSAG